MFESQIAQVLSEISGLNFYKIKEKIEIPPDSKMGDYAFPCFILSKEMKKNPIELAKELAAKIDIPAMEVKAVGPYINFFVDANKLVGTTVTEVLTLKENYAKGHKQAVVLVESPGPNTNKPLHLGHLRNILLGDSIFKILKQSGKTAHIVNVINDRGVHICKSMLAYQKFGKGVTPESSGIKSDHFVGDFYVEYNNYVKEHPEAEAEVQEMLVKWEAGDPEIRALWAKMNEWALSGFAQTYKSLNFNIDREYFESNTYLFGREIIVDGFEKGIFSKNADGAIVCDLEDKKLGTKVLLRGNGTSVYITQDIFMAKKRYDEYKFDEMIYVVGNEQEHHFKVLFEVFKKLGWAFGDKCSHFSYGMIALPDGKMKSREGNVIDTDNLLVDMALLAKEEIVKRHDDLTAEEIDRRAKIVANGAIRFFFLKHDPRKDFIFNPKESLAFEGDTGPYVQYTHARICSILRKAEFKLDSDNGSDGINLKDINLLVLNTDLDKEVVKTISEFAGIVDKAGADLAPNLVCNYLTRLAQKFNTYYVSNKIIQDDIELQNARLALICAVKIVLVNGLKLVGIEAPEEM